MWETFLHQIETGISILLIGGMSFFSHGPQARPTNYIVPSVTPVSKNIVLTVTPSKSPVRISPTPTAIVKNVSPTQVSDSPAKVPTVIQTSFRVDSVNPTEGNFLQTITLQGSGFGSEQGSVIWFGQSVSGPEEWNIGGSPIVSWSDTEIKANVIFLKGKNIYQLEVHKKNGDKSNRTNFKVIEGQPQLTSWPNIGVPGREIILKGEEFGTEKGHVELRGPSSNDAAGNCEITYWSDEEIHCKLPSSLSTFGDYGVGVVSADNRPASYQYINMCAPDGCG